MDREPKPGSSISEIDVFAALNVVLGTGVLGPSGSVRPDMVFLIEGEYQRRVVGTPRHRRIGNHERYELIVEYDGEYWHRHHERRDITKYPYVGDGPEVMRLRMQPLRRLRPVDISVPSRADATTCARLALLHLAHRPLPFLISEALMQRIGIYLQFCATPLAEGDIACGLCAELDHVLREGVEFYHTSGSPMQVNDSSLWDFAQLARALSDRSQHIDGLWVPDPNERHWEQAEAEAVSPSFTQRHQIALGHHSVQDIQSTPTESVAR
ncbi:hypothetical protein [Nocardia sp. NBC_00416]|uniref:hypothetical protein n=1 Tax=Nocardia sp. NBC_00416 TaxID=2975991 RepID=UPI002E1AB29C